MQAKMGCMKHTGFNTRKYTRILCTKIQKYTDETHTMHNKHYHAGKVELVV